MFDPDTIDDVQRGLQRVIRRRLSDGAWFQGGLQGIMQELRQTVADRSAERATQQKFHDYFRNVVPHSTYLQPYKPTRLYE